MMIAAIIILTSVVGIYSMQREDAEDIALRNIAFKLTDAINDMNSLLGETLLNVSFEEGKSGLYLPPTVNGEKYEIRITRYEVLIKQKDSNSLESFIGEIHLWKPENDMYDSLEIINLNEKYNELIVDSHKDFVIQRKGIEVDGEKEYMTFVYQ
jgi:hypothetical protein